MPGVQPNHCLGILRKNIRHRPLEQSNEEHTAFFAEKTMNFHRNINNNREFYDENENSEKKQYSGMLKSKISNNRRINDDSELINNEKERSFANACVQTNNLNLIDENRTEKINEFEENNEFISGIRNKYREYGRNQERKNIENDDNLDFPTREQENNSKNYTKYLNYLQEKEKYVVKNVLQEKDNINFFKENQKKLEKSEIEPQTYFYENKNKNYDYECLPKKTLPVEKIETNMEIRKNEYSRYLREEPEKNTEFDDFIENDKINKSWKKSEIKKSENEKKRQFKNSLEEDISRILRAEEFNEEFNEEKSEIKEINEKNYPKNSKTEQIYHKMFNEVVNDRFSEQGK